jgi:hypothetical protein
MSTEQLTLFANTVDLVITTRNIGHGEKSKAWAEVARLCNNHGLFGARLIEVAPGEVVNIPGNIPPDTFYKVSSNYR